MMVLLFWTFKGQRCSQLVFSFARTCSFHGTTEWAFPYPFRRSMQRFLVRGNSLLLKHFSVAEGEVAMQTSSGKLYLLQVVANSVVRRIRRELARLPQVLCLSLHQKSALVFV